MMTSTGIFAQHVKTLVALDTAADPAGTAASALWVEPYSAGRITFQLHLVNGAAPVGAAISLRQATDNAGADAKPLIDPASGAVPMQIYTVVRSAANRDLDRWETSKQPFEEAVTLTDVTPDSVVDMFLDIDISCLDLANGFTHLQASIADGAGADVKATILAHQWPVG